MLKLYLNKMALFIVTQIILTSFLNAKEPTLAILLSVTSNNHQTFNIGNYHFNCKTYGVISIDELKFANENNLVCQESIKNLYKKNIHLKYISNKLLKLRQMYHFEFKNSECVLYSNGQKTLSEILLEEGVAIVKPRFKDREFQYSFKKAQSRAKNEKKGMWSENVPGKCLAELVEQ
ncbi:MAG: thermonuclease family protein [Campylobacterota bacterium]|nr:thermonuclease family protein [Campylobacterota bacterium]